MAYTFDTLGQLADAQQDYASSFACVSRSTASRYCCRTEVCHYTYVARHVRSTWDLNIATHTVGTAVGDTQVADLTVWLDTDVHILKLELIGETNL